MRELVIWKIPQNVWAEICVLIRVSILTSLPLALLLNTSLSFTLPCIICLVFYNTLEKEITNSRDHLCSSNLEIWSPVQHKFHNSAWKYVVPYAEAKWMHLVLYITTEYHNYKQYIIIPFYKYLSDIRSEAWPNHFWEHINRKLFAVQEEESIL